MHGIVDCFTCGSEISLQARREGNAPDVKLSRVQSRVAALNFPSRLKHSPRPHIVRSESTETCKGGWKTMKPNIGRAVAGGFVGTLAMTLMMYLVAPMMGVKMDIAGGLAAMMGTSWALGLMMHFINGTVIFPLIYTFLLFRVLKGGAVAKGMEWGLMLWLAAQLVVMPMTGAGVFSSKMGGAMAVMGSLIGHVIYGALLGVVARGATTFQAKASAARTL
jgi:uncharacterized membrane protein YagU involved in acid resistance